VLSFSWKTSSWICLKIPALVRRFTVFFYPIQAGSFAFLVTLLPKGKEVDMQHPHSVFLVSCTQQQ
jgi:hypothetical protein